MRRRHGRKGKFSFYFIFFIICGCIGLAGYVYNSQIFERQPPNIQIAEELFWNLKTEIPIRITDSSGIKFVRAVLSDGENSVVLFKEVFDQPQQDINLKINFPQTGLFGQKEKYNLEIEAVDSSKWNFFSGNKSIANSVLQIDTKRPSVYTIANSYKITKGGAAVVIFRVEDQNLDEVYVLTSSGDKFYPTPFYKPGHYITLVAWPSKDSAFKAEVIATDKAQNIRKDRIKYYIEDKKYRKSNIKIKDDFIQREITDLVEKYSSTNVDLSPVELFKFVNEELRTQNDKEIKKFSNHTSKELIEKYVIKDFYPLKNAAAVAGFGDFRNYFYKDKKISQAYHLGLDLASTAQANIFASNDGVVVYAQDNGIYGQNLIINHGLGLHSLYAHCSSFIVDVGDEVKAGDIIATTGMTGLALGDHLHFSVLIQGVEVRPEEWMDKKWINDNLFNVIKEAKKIIDRKR